MSINTSKLIHGYLDDSLTSEEQKILEEWIKADAAHARTFAAEVMLHDRLRNISADLNNDLVSHNNHYEEPRSLTITTSSYSTRMVISWATAITLLFFGGLFFWQIMGNNSLSAAAIELDRLIAVSSHQSDRTFTIAVEETAIPEIRRESNPPQHNRPPKPSLHDALLYVRSPNLFVLQRQLGSDAYFITGSNGNTSWAVRPEGPVRVSADMSRFNHDLPGHEHAMPLCNLHDGLQKLHTAYEVEVLPMETLEEDEASDIEPSRLLVAVKKRGYRGPKRVEITYGASSGHIQQLRFIEMPYGPERITIRMTLVHEQNLPVHFFDHESHHDPKRIVEFEE